jgi:AraC-like DNA-binding protein
MSGVWTKGVVHAFRRLGLDVGELCASIGVDIEIFLDTAGRPLRDDSGRLWRAALAASGDRFLGLSAAEVWDAQVDHLVFLLLLSADTFGEGLTAGVRFQELMSHGPVLTFGEHPEHHALQINRVEHELPVTAHEIEFMAAVFMKLFRFATDNAFAAEEVHFEHPFRGCMEKYSRAFRTTVRFGQRHNTLLISDATWNIGLAHGNELLHRELRWIAAGLHAEHPDRSFLNSVRSRIKALLPKGNYGVESVAEALHMTPRTLQRRLQEEGTTFRALLDATRKSIVLDYVERRQATDEIVRQAGYTNPRSFRRAMKRWNL